MLQAKPTRRRVAVRLSVAILLLGALLTAPVAMAAVAVVVISGVVGATVSDGDNDAEGYADLQAAARTAATRCDSATAATLMATALLPPGSDGTDPIVGWVSAWQASGQYRQLRTADDPEDVAATQEGVVAALAVVWCALHDGIAAHHPDTADRTTFLALGAAASVEDALIRVPQPVDDYRVQQWSALLAEFEQQLAQPASAGSVSAQGWTHPIPALVTYQGNYGQVRAGYIHAGEDLSAPLDTPIYAAANGTVTRASCLGYEGRSPCNIIISHGLDQDGQMVETWYVHMYPAGVLVSTGDQVSVGQQIGLTGSNGNSTGPHLHLEVHLGGRVVDPSTFFEAHGIDLRNPSAAPAITAAAGQALAWARTQIGAPYRWGAAGPDAYDCSGLTMRAYDSAGVQLPRTSREQYTATTRIQASELQPGDLVFWSSDGTTEGIYHVALYAGAGRIVQAPAPGSDVEEQAMWQTGLFGYGRVP